MPCSWCFQLFLEAINSLQCLGVVQALSGNGIQPSASSDQVEAAQGGVLTPISPKQGLFQKCAAVYHQLMSHMVRALIWFDSRFRVECCELGQTLRPARAVVTIHEHNGRRGKVSVLQKRWRNSRRKTALRRGSWGKLDALRSRFWQIWQVSGLGQWEGRGEMIL